MNCWIFIFALAALASAAHSEKKIVCYFGSWAVYRPSDGKFDISDIQSELCTHLIYSFVGLTTDGNVKVLDEWLDLPDNWGKDAFGRFNKLREQNPGIKTLIAIGGWNEGSTTYSQVVASPTLRAKLCKNIVEFTLKHRFDGFDIDWEYPNQRGGKPEDVQNYVKLLQELRPEFDKHKLLLTAAVAAAEPSASLSYDIPAISKYLDFINVMTYDFYGPWDKTTGLNAPLYSGHGSSELKLNVDACVRYWLKSGCPPEKLIVGVPSYGRTFTLANTNQYDLGAPARGPGTAGPYTREAGILGYNEICVLIKESGWTITRSEGHYVPYAFKNDQWVGYDDVTSLNEKANYINSLNLGGAMIWSIETDDFRGNCGEKYPLLKTLNAKLRGKVIPIEPSKPTESPKETNPPKPPTAQPTQPPATAPPNGICKKVGYVRDEKDCNVFFQCMDINGTYKIAKFNCPSGLAFDVKSNNCNYKKLVDGCNQR